MVIIYSNSHEKLTKREIRSSYPDLTICALFTLYMYSSIETAPLCKILAQSDHYSFRYCISKNITYIWPYLALVTLILEYLLLIALILPYVPYSPCICVLVLRLHLCAKFERNRIITYSWRYCISKNWGIHLKCRHECSLGVNLVIDNFLYVACDTLPLY